MRVAAVDIGTNTVRLLIADVAGNQIVDIHRATEVVGLGRGLDRTGALGGEPMEAAIAALREFGSAIAAAAPGRVKVVATSASRDASNAGPFLERVADAVGAAPAVISGEQEAAISFAGAVWGSGESGRHLVIDPGGGSTEFVTGITRPDSAVSIDVGSVRLTDRMLPDRPPASSDLAAAIDHVRTVFSTVPVFEEVQHVVGVAGTFTSLAAILLGLSVYDRSRVHGTVMTIGDLDAAILRLAMLTREETAAIPSLDPKRAPVILAGAVIAAEAVRRVGAGAIRISESDMLEGIVLGLAGE